MAELGNYGLEHALNKLAPAARRANLGTMLKTMISIMNIATAQNDIALAVNAGDVAFASGTLTIAGSVTNGDWFTVTFVNSAAPLLVSPGIVIGPVNIVGADTATTIAVKLKNLLNANLTLMQLGYNATNSAGVVTVKGPGAATNSLVMTAQRSAGATVTVTPVNPSSGTGTVVSRLAAAYPLTPLGNL